MKKETKRMLAVLGEPEVSLRFEQNAKRFMALCCNAIDKMTLKSLFSEL